MRIYTEDWLDGKTEILAKGNVKEILGDGKYLIETDQGDLRMFKETSLTLDYKIKISDNNEVGVFYKEIKQWGSSNENREDAILSAIYFTKSYPVHQSEFIFE